MSEAKKRAGVRRLPHDVALAVKAMTEAVEEVHEESRRTGQPIPVWRDGKVVWIIPEKQTAPPRPARKKRGRGKGGGKSNK